MKHFTYVPLATLLLAAPLGAQGSLEAACNEATVQAAGAYDECLAVVQAAVSAQPALGLVIAGGNPTIGSAGSTGLRMGFIPRTSAGIRLNVVGVKLPDIIGNSVPGTVGDVTRRFGAPVPSLLGDLSVAVTRGASLAPGLGGIGAISLLGSASWLPFDQLGIDGFNNSANVAWGFGGRIHVLNESFVAPGIAVSVMRRGFGTLRFGDVCEGLDPLEGTGGTSACTGPGDPGEVLFDLTDWSGRAVVSKHLLGFGLTAGLGYDRYASDLDFGVRAPEPIVGANPTPIFRFRNQELDSSRWTVFGNASYTLIFGTIGLEAGWQQGEAPLSSFENIGSDFDPRSGTWFGSLGARVAL